MKKQVVVIGLGRLGIALATTLHSLGHDVLALDIDEKNVQNIASQLTHAVQADATNETALRELGIGNFDIAIVTISEVGSSVLTTVLLRKLGVGFIIARAESELHGSILEKIGADKVVYPEREMGTMIAHVLTLGDVIDYLPVTTGYGVVKLIIPSSFVGQTLFALGFGSKGGWKVAVLLILRNREVIVTPSSAEVIKAEDTLVVSGTWDSLEKLMGKSLEIKAEPSSAN
jgi:trk system potassium uptake protein TrkA